MWNKNFSIFIVVVCLSFQNVFCVTLDDGIDDVEFCSYGLPCFYITTADSSVVDSKEEWKQCSIFIEDSCRTDSTLLEDSTVYLGYVKGRGNSTWMHNTEKKSFSIKLEKRHGLLGMKKHKRWVAVANYFDKSLLRNSLASYIGNNVFNSYWNPSFVSVNMFLNGQYLGVYIIGEQIKIDKNRLDIQPFDELESDENGDGVVDDLDGGFIVEVVSKGDEEPHFETSDDVKFVVKEPDTLTDNQLEIVKTIVNNAENAIRFGSDRGVDYKDYINVNSFVDWYLVHEFLGNLDSGFWTSCYLHYNPAVGKIFMGPNWDFDMACGSSNYFSNSPEGFIMRKKWIEDLCCKASFMNEVKQRWNERKSDLYDAIEHGLDSLVAEVEPSAELNFVRFPILGVFEPPICAHGWEKRTTYESEIDYLREFLFARFIWMDNQFDEKSPVMNHYSDYLIFASPDTYEIFNYKDDMPICVYDASGRLVYSGQSSFVKVPSVGVYFIKAGDVVKKVIVGK